MAAVQSAAKWISETFDREGDLIYTLHHHGRVILSTYDRQLVGWIEENVPGVRWAVADDLRSVR